LYVFERASHMCTTAISVSLIQLGFIQYSRLDETNFSKNSCNLSLATENETWSLDKMLDIVVFNNYK
jgi:hypothetical protein